MSCATPICCASEVGPRPVPITCCCAAIGAAPPAWAFARPPVIFAYPDQPCCRLANSAATRNSLSSSAGSIFTSSASGRPIGGPDRCPRAASQMLPRSRTLAFRSGSRLVLRRSEATSIHRDRSSSLQPLWLIPCKRPTAPMALPSHSRDGLAARIAEPWQARHRAAYLGPHPHFGLGRSAGAGQRWATRSQEAQRRCVLHEVRAAHDRRAAAPAWGSELRALGLCVLRCLMAATCPPRAAAPRGELIGTFLTRRARD
jgi:hypothetical protein